MAENLGGYETDKAHKVAAGREGDEAPVVPTVEGEDRSGDRCSSQSPAGDRHTKSLVSCYIHSEHHLPKSGNGKANVPKANDGITGGVVTPIMLSLAHLANAYRCQTDVASAGEAKNEGIGHNHGNAVTSRKPQTCSGQEAEYNGRNHRVESAHVVRCESRDPASEEGTGVENGDELVRQILGYPVLDGVGRDIGEGHEKSKLYEEDTSTGESEKRLPEDAEVREDVLFRGPLLG